MQHWKSALSNERYFAKFCFGDVFVTENKLNSRETRL